MQSIIALLFLLSMLTNISLLPGAVERKSYEDPDTGLEYDIYRRSGKPARKVILLTHGMVDEGKDHEEIVVFARTLAKTGFAVFVPDIDGLKDAQLGYGEVRDLREAMRLMVRLFPGQKRGVMSFCFGNGVTIAALDSDVKNDIDFLVAWGSYADLREQARYGLTGHYRAPGGEVHIEPPESIREMYRSQRSWFSFVPRNQRRALNHAINLDIRKGLGSDVRSIMDFLDNRDPVRYDQLYDRLPEAARNWVEYMSAKNHIHNIDCTTVFYHNYYDTIVPYQATLSLYEISPSKNKRKYIAALFRHFERIELKGFLKADLSAMIRGFLTYYRLVNAVLSVE